MPSKTGTSLSEHGQGQANGQGGGDGDLHLPRRTLLLASKCWFVVWWVLFCFVFLNFPASHSLHSG